MFLLLCTHSCPVLQLCVQTAESRSSQQPIQCSTDTQTAFIDSLSAAQSGVSDKHRLPTAAYLSSTLHPRNWKCSRSSQRTLRMEQPRHFVSRISTIFLFGIAAHLYLELDRKAEVIECVLSKATWNCCLFI